MIITSDNTLPLVAERSFTSVATPVGASTLPVKNINAYTTSWGIQLGETGEEQSEVLLITASPPSGTALLVTGTARFGHPQDTPVYAIKYDKVIFKRSTAGTAGTATAMTNGTITITPDSLTTNFDDTTAATTYAYKTQWYNSVTTDVSDESDWITPAGPTFYSRRRIRDRIKNKLFSVGYIKSDDIINEWIDEWTEDMTNAAIQVNQDYSLGTVNVGFGTAGYGTITSADFKQVRRLWVTYDGNQFFNSTKQPITGFEPNQQLFKTHPYHAYLGDTIFQIQPAQTGGTAQIVYSKLSPIMTTDSAELPTSMRAYTKSFVNYGLAQAYFLDQKPDPGKTFLGMARADRDIFISQIIPRDQTGPQYIDLVEPLDADTSSDFII